MRENEENTYTQTQTPTRKQTCWQRAAIVTQCTTLDKSFSWILPSNLTQSWNLFANPRWILMKNIIIIHADFSSCVRWCVCVCRCVCGEVCKLWQSLYYYYCWEQLSQLLYFWYYLPRVCLRELKCNYVVGQTQKA